MVTNIVWFLYRVNKLLPFIYNEIKRRLIGLFIVFLFVLVLREVFYLMDFFVWVLHADVSKKMDTLLLFINYFTELLPPLIILFSVKNIDEFAPEKKDSSFLGV